MDSGVALNISLTPALHRKSGLAPWGCSSTDLCEQPGCIPLPCAVDLLICSVSYFQLTAYDSHCCVSGLFLYAISTTSDLRCFPSVAVTGTCFSLNRKEVLCGQIPVSLYSASEPFSTKSVAIMLSAILNCESPYIGTQRDFVAIASRPCFGVRTVEPFNALELGAVNSWKLTRRSTATASLRIITPAFSQVILYSTASQH